MNGKIKIKRQLISLKIISKYINEFFKVGFKKSFNEVHSSLVLIFKAKLVRAIKCKFAKTEIKTMISKL